MTRRRIQAGTVAGLTAALLISAVPALASASAATAADGTTTSTRGGTGTGGTAARGTSYRTQQTRWVGAGGLAAGRSKGFKVTAHGLRLDAPTRTLAVADPYGTKRAATYDRVTWTSPWATTGFPATNLVPSWNALARNGALARIEVRVASGTTVGSWDEVATWGFAHTGVRRHSGAAQSDDLARLSTDTVQANPGRTFDKWRVRVTLLRPQGTKRRPTLVSVGATAADYSTKSQPVSATTMKAAQQLNVPTYSQMVHTGHHPEWGGGGEAWCSPTSTAMVMRFHGKGPGAGGLTWERGVDPVVDHAARHTYDHRYRGTGNWPFTTAFAGNYGLDAHVTRLRDLRDAEKLIRQGIPVVTSVKFGRGQLNGAPISSTNGHLMVIVGFTSTGQVIVNDPAAAKNSTVRRTYDRAQFERAWLGGSGGISYLIQPRR